MDIKEKKRNKIPFMNRKKLLAIASAALFVYALALWIVFASEDGVEEESSIFLFPVGLLGCVAVICAIYAFATTIKKKSALSTLVLSLWVLIYFVGYAFSLDGCHAAISVSIFIGVVGFIAIWAFYGLIYLIRNFIKSRN